MEARNRLLPDWFARIRTRQITLPRFQRFEAWTHDRVTAVLNNILRELPIGSVLILEIGDNEPFISRPMVGAPSTGERVVEQLLDGQQRLTALWRSLTNNYSERSYFVCLEEDEESGAPNYVVSYARYLREGKRYPVWHEDPKEVWNRKLLPIHLMRPDTDAEKDLDAWALEASEGDTATVLEIVKVANRLRQKFAKFNIPFLALPNAITRETALNVFIQMNTSAEPLTAYDIVVAQVEAGTGESLHDLAEELNHDLPTVEAYTSPADLMLAVNALLQDKVPSKSTYLSPEFSGPITENWARVKMGIGFAVKFLEAEGIFDNKRLPTDVALYPLAALWSVAPTGLDAEGQARTVLRKYIWRSFFTDRYERTSATRALVDFREIKSVFDGNAQSEPMLFDEKEYRLPSIEELMIAGWPRRKDRLPRSLLALALRAGGFDFADGTPASRDHLPRREYHHLFPRAHLQELNLPGREIDRALNCALVSWKTNRNISAKKPSAYLLERIDGNSLGEPEVQRRLQSHLIPYAEFMANSYQKFLEARAEQMHANMRRLCNGELV